MMRSLVVRVLEAITYVACGALAVSVLIMFSLISLVEKDGGR